MKRILQRGKPLTEMVKGSLDYAVNEIRTAFRRQFPMPYDGGSGEYYIVETFADHVIVSEYSRDGSLASDEFYFVPFTQDANGGYAFAPRDQWEIVELAYQPQTTAEAQAMAERKAVATQRKGKGKRIDERLTGGLTLSEAQADNDKGPWKIKAIGITANVINGNGRRYSAEVLREAVAEAKTHLTESFSQGRLVMTGEPEHPHDKSTGRPTLLETVVNWTNIDFDGSHVLLEGLLLGTQAGRDIHAQIVGGVMPDVSQRAKGESHTVKNGGQLVEDVDWCRINGYDLIANGWGSDPEAGVTLSESQNHLEESEDMDLEKLKAMLKEHPELFEGLVSGKTLDEKLAAVAKMQAEQLKALDESMRKVLGIEAGADLGEALREAAEARKELAESKRKQAIGTAIDEACKDLPYGDLNATFVESVRAANPQDAAAVKSLVESKRKEYDALTAKARLAAMGFRGAQVLGPTLERATGIPAHLAPVHQLTEALVQRGQAQARNWNEPKSINERVTARILARFDKMYMHVLDERTGLPAGLAVEAKRLEEAETTSDLSLPYSVARAIIAEAFPMLVALSVFDVDTTDQSPTTIFYEAYENETGATGTVTDEAVTADLGNWVALAQKRLTPGTVVVTSSPAGTTYDEGDDFVIDYANGEFMALSTGSISDAQALLVDYGYAAIRKGEGAAIERGKGTLTSQTLEMAADRLATQITKEAIVFSRSQLGWDAVTRTLGMLIKQIGRKIDQGLLRMALDYARGVASNSGGTWTAASDDLAKLFEYIGLAKVKIANRYYDPTAIICSVTNSDRMANAETFTQTGARVDASINAAGYVVTAKGLPVFASTEFPDTHVLVVNREMVMHRIFQPMALMGPYPVYSGGKLVASQEWYAEEFNGSKVPVPGKAAYVSIV